MFVKINNQYVNFGEVERFYVNGKGNILLSFRSQSCLEVTEFKNNIDEFANYVNKQLHNNKFNTKLESIIE